MIGLWSNIFSWLNPVAWRRYFASFKFRRRQKLIAAPFPSEWQTILDETVRVYELLPPADQARLRDLIRIFLAERTLEGCGGLEMSDEIRVTVAALACVPILGLEIDAYASVMHVLVYPQVFVAPDQKGIGDDLALHEESERLGEAHYRGPIILSWQDTLEAAQKPGFGHNVVYHEFAHQLDMLNGQLDGTPKITDTTLRKRWADTMFREFKSLKRASRQGRETLLDPYGAEEPAEFFAVAVETFFDAPWPMAEKHPELYALLRDYFRQDPAKWKLPEE